MTTKERAGKCRQEDSPLAIQIQKEKRLAAMAQEGEQENKRENERRGERVRDNRQKRKMIRDNKGRMSKIVTLGAFWRWPVNRCLFDHDLA